MVAQRGDVVGQRAEATVATGSDVPKKGNESYAYENEVYTFGC